MPDSTSEQGCFRCGKSLLVVPGPTSKCRKCNARFCSPCIDAYHKEQRETCPRCNEALPRSSGSPPSRS